MSRAGLGVTVALTVCWLASRPAAQPQMDVGVRHWLSLVRDHQPGENDAPAREAGRWSWKTLESVLQSVKKEGAPHVILRSAALMLDLVVHVPEDERARGLVEGYSLIAMDGDPRGKGTLDSHLEAGRRLLEALPSERPDATGSGTKTDVVDWYRAVSSLLIGRANLADLEPHVIRALARFDDDPNILFDAGRFYEAYGSPEIQLAKIDDRHPLPFKASPVEFLRAFQQSTGNLLREAEKLFRRAAERDPSFAEARVRLGRLLAARGRTDEAIRELQTAVRLEAPAPVKYYGFLSLGKALARAGRPADAIAAYESAAALFPRAQSPQLGISQIAGDTGDPVRARAAVERVLATNAEPDGPSDLWWEYQGNAGRDHEAPYKAFAARMRRLPRLNVELWRER